MINYKLIADNDPGGDLTVAYQLMKAEAVTAPQDRKLTYIQVANEAGFAAATELQLKIKTAIGRGSFPALVDSALSGEGININDPQVATVITQLGLEAATQAAILALKNVSAAKYPGLKEGHLQNARRMKAVADADQGRAEEEEVSALLPSFVNLTVSELVAVRRRRERGTI